MIQNAYQLKSFSRNKKKRDCVDLFLSDLISRMQEKELLTECFDPAGLLRRAEPAIASPDVAVAAGAVGLIELCL